MRTITVDNSKTYEEQCKVAFMRFLAELPNFVLSVISAVLSNTLLVWADTAVSLETTLHCFLVYCISRKMKKETGDRYNFGLGRLETFTSFICDLFMLVGGGILIAVSIYGILKPSRPEDVLGFFLILKVSNITFDAIFYARQLKIKKNHESRLNDTEAANVLNNLVLDVVTGVLGCFCFFLRSFKWSWYISPVASLVMAIVFMIQCIRRMVGAANELADVSIPVREQDAIFDIFIEYAFQIKKVYEVNCRMMNHKLYVEAHIAFKEDFTFAKQQELIGEIDTRIKLRFPDSTTRFVIQPKAIGNGTQ